MSVSVNYGGETAVGRKGVITDERAGTLKTSRYVAMPDLIRHLHPCPEAGIQRSAEVGRCRIGVRYDDIEKRRVLEWGAQ